MSATIPVFVNDRPLLVPAGATAETAALSVDPSFSDELSAGRAYLTDGRGLPVNGDLPLSAGAIVRIVRSSRRSASGTDAEP